MNSNFFSNVHNFQSAAIGNVDPRTGLFNYLMPIAHLIGNNYLGPEQAIMLSYSPLNTNDIGFGAGFSIGLTQYDAQNRLLILSTGERYKVDETAETVFLRQYKQNAIRFEKDVTKNVYRVIHKSGRVEVLTGPQNAFDLKVPIQIVNPLGYSLKLSWHFNLSTIPYLSSIADEEKALLNIHYELGAYTRITVWPNTSESYDIQLLFNNEYMVSIQKGVAGQMLKWEMDYDTDNRFLTQVLSPTGLKEIVDYNSDGHQLPDNANLPILPYVARYTQSPGHGPDIVRTYEYTHFNFLGYGAAGNWSRDEDYLYNIFTYYRYGSTESWQEGKTQRHITRRYNNYHLLTSEVIQQNDCKRHHKTEYYAQIGVDFEDQPPQFQMPKSAIVRFNEAANGENHQIQFDGSGNPTVQIAPDGTRTDWTYYPASGEAGACPPDPHGFVRFVKSKTVTPGQCSPEGIYEEVPVYKTIYRYAQLPARLGSPLSYAVVRTYQGTFSAGRLLLERQTHYVNEVTSPHHGRLHRVDETVHGTQDGGQAWTSQQVFSYVLQGEALVQGIQWTGHDQLSIATQRTQSRVSGKLWHEVDAQGRTTRYHYDTFGRILKRLNNEGTDYAREITYAYAIEDAGAVTTTQTDAWGNQVRTRFDGLGRAYQQEKLEKGQEKQGWRLVSETIYDNGGRVEKHVSHDWLPVGEGTGAIAQVSSGQCFEYDDWGQRYLVIKDTGERLRHEYDPATRTAQITRLAEGLRFGKTTVVYNARHQPVTITHYDSQGQLYSQQIHHYDGLGRLRATIDELNQKTEYIYDLFSRVSAIKHSDGTVIRKNYAPFSAGNLLTQIEAGGHVLGTRDFDSLQRNIATTCGGRTYRHTYQGGSPYPSQSIDPLAQTVTHHYEPLLGNALTKVEAEGIEQRFSYDLKTGAMTQASASQIATHEMSYTASGRLRQTRYHFEDGQADAVRAVDYTYSPLGLMTDYKDVTGEKCYTRFDSFGRPIARRDSDIEITLTYDTASRVNSWMVHDKQHNQKLTITLSFDDFGREVNRQLWTNTDTLTLEQGYNVKGQVISRSTRSQASGVLRQETYTYDPARSWLREYHCTGSELSRDAYGFGIACQRFTYDVLGNIQTCITTLEDGHSDTATFTYSEADPCQLHGVTHTHPGYPATITLAYDNAGRLIRDEAGRHLTYDALGRLSSVRLNVATSDYAYDAANRLVLQYIDAEGIDAKKIGTKKTYELYYQGAIRVAEILRESGAATRLLHAHGETVATVTGPEVHLLGTDKHSSVLLSHKGNGAETRYRYSPHGQQAADERAPDLPAYNGGRLDPVWGTYHLGNGYRTYNPVLMRFTAPDNLSPFGAGGINSYAYCLNDPINRTDPSGHMSLGGILGIVFGTVGLVVGIVLAIPTGGASLSIGGAVLAGLGLAADATGIASAVTEDSDPHTSAILGWVSMGLGVVSMGAGAIGGVTIGMRRSGNRLITSFSHGMSGRRVPEAANNLLENTEYTRTFQSMLHENRVRQIENPVSSGAYTLKVYTDGLNDDVIRRLDRLGFEIISPNGESRMIDNISNALGIQFSLNITERNYLSLYGQFITSNTPYGSIHIINRFRHIINTYRRVGLSLSDQVINSMEDAWRATRFSDDVNRWLHFEMLERWPNIGESMTEERLQLSAFDIYNDFVPNID
ncbi:RHS family protein [Xenorhabdus vietnamensis]|uniref:RHS family protein n=1 Tax=Xenorhabdus vietnamensis TaxID=351656 RepID=A0A1Y2SF49_9GAMM|nr:RHS repeat-associated core domain-containing protein [Xenorhabdus vietnamensis]OTA17395.1 RHS family protein [Xenorhabdus vietnamensis]